MRHVVMFVTLLAASAAWAADGPEVTSTNSPKALSGMSVLGNNEAPKSLVLIPWKSSQIGDGIGVVESLSNRPMPVDRDVFSRELDYYQIRTSSHDAAGSAPEDLAVGSR